ncbi:hypothetical protein [Carboxylicivirga taeanensis]|uniref:hypothetical protein n=1 Tax=Carboxylicivirga taeanensis TaxID=1416875 RepID=UPI003F6DEA8E
MKDVLDALEPYFDSLTQDEEDKLDELHAVFQNHFIDNTFEIDGKKLVVKRHIYNPRKDGLPAHFSRYFEKFVHIVTRTENLRRGKKRSFRADRANRIHWIKPILENRNDERISCFKFQESDDTIREYFWYKAKKYMVILEEVLPDYFLITGFCVDDKNLNYYLNKERNQCA